MNYRYMRLVVLYDLPMSAPNYVKAYTQFRTFLIKDGYVMVQFSVYAKLCLNQDSLNHALRRLERNLPEFGNIRALQVTEKQYQKIKVLVGSKSQDEINQTDKRLVIV